MAALRASGLSVRYGEHLAVDNLDLHVDAGSIAGLIGPNGAGKSSAFNALAGVQRCTGTVELNGADISTAPAHARARLGLNRTFQRLEVFGSMTVRDNILTAAEISAGARRVRRRSVRSRVDELVHQLGLDDVAERRADSLPTGQARLVELGRALSTEPSVLLLDEPASGLDEVETRRLATVLTEVSAAGTAILLVEHDIDLVMELCADIFVQSFGQLIAHGPPDLVRTDPDVRAAYLGEVA